MKARGFDEDDLEVEKDILPPPNAGIINTYVKTLNSEKGTVKDVPKISAGLSMTAMEKTEKRTEIANGSANDPPKALIVPAEPALISQKLMDKEERRRYGEFIKRLSKTSAGSAATAVVKEAGDGAETGNTSVKLPPKIPTGPARPATAAALRYPSNSAETRNRSVRFSPKAHNIPFRPAIAPTKDKSNPRPAINSPARFPPKIPTGPAAQRPISQERKDKMADEERRRGFQNKDAKKASVNYKGKKPWDRYRERNNKIPWEKEKESESGKPLKKEQGGRDGTREPSYGKVLMTF
jgi:hypothetical protein